MKAMVKESERRYQTAAEMLRDLENLQRQLAEWRSARATPVVPRSSAGPKAGPGERERTQVVAEAEAGGEPGQTTLPGAPPGVGRSGRRAEATGVVQATGAAGPGRSASAAGGRRAAQSGGHAGGGGGQGREGDAGDFVAGGDDLYDLDTASPGRARRRWSRTTLWIASFAAFLVLVAVGLFFVVQWFEVPEVSVPNVVGLGVIEAQTRLEQQRLSGKIVAYEYSAEVPNGQVVDQDPDAGVTVRASRQVDLWVSKGPELIAEVPNIVGLAWREAKITLEQAGLAVSEADIKYAFNETVAEDRVISQDPKAGAQNLPRGAKAYLVVSLGPQAGTVVVPNFIGQSLDAARLLLPGLRLTEGTITSVESTQAAGTILEQNPVAGTSVAAGTAVSFTVAGGGGSEPGGDGEVHTYRVTFIVPAGAATQNVRIVVTDNQGQRTVYDHDHAVGFEGKVDVDWTGTSLHVQVYYAGTLTDDYTVTP